MARKLFFAVCIAALLFSSCQKEKFSKIRMANYSLVTSTGAVAISNDYVWLDGILQEKSDYIGFQPFGHQYFVYDNDNLVEMNDEIAQEHQYYYYNGERLKSFLSIINGDTTINGKVISYTSKGEIKEVEYYEPAGRTIFEFRWDKGNVTEMRKQLLDNQDNLVFDTTYRYNFDKSPSIYTGIPSCLHLITPALFPERASKNNLFSDEYEYTYDEQNRLVEFTKPNSGLTTRITYLEE